MSRAGVGARALERFLSALAEGATVEEACRAAHVGRSTIYGYRRDDPDFASRWDAARAEGLDNLEDELFARALDRSDPQSADLLKFLLSRHRPGTFGRALRLEIDQNPETAAQISTLTAVLGLSPADTSTGSS
jgi:hypothetical protein